MLGGKVDIDLRLLLIRQIQLDSRILFFTAQHEGFDQLLELRCSFLVVMLLDRIGKTMLKPARIPQVTGIEEFVDRPQLRQSIFNRRTCQRNTVLCFEGADGDGLFVLRVLDVLGFVQTEGAP
ncbi:hypothetical protein D3C73_992130 [compost metagenome]